jgi:hypothetical protein
VSDHVHEWGPYEDVPFGDQVARYKRCTAPDCRVVGYVRHSALSYGGDSSRLRVQPYKCGVKGCHKNAVDRKKGRCGPRNNFFWLCPEHLHMKDD